mgnify:CR=1 FL=1
MGKTNTITIEQYLLGKTGYDIDSDALQSIYVDRGIPSGDTPVTDIDQKTRDLATADLYLRCAATPGSSSSIREKDGDWSHERTGQKSDAWGKGKLIDMANALYAKWGEEEFTDTISVVAFGHSRKPYRGRIW